MREFFFSNYIKILQVYLGNKKKMYFNNKFVIIYIQQKIVKYCNKSKLKLQHVI